MCVYQGYLVIFIIFLSWVGGYIYHKNLDPLYYEPRCIELTGELYILRKEYDVVVNDLRERLQNLNKNRKIKRKSKHITKKKW